MSTGLSLDLVVPVHDEADTIEATIEEWCELAERLGVRLRVVVSEDGSNDGSRAVIERLAERRPVLLLPGGPRLGYSRAVVTGIRATTAPWVCCVDGDGQCDPADLESVLARREDADLVVGIRRPRADPPLRCAMSASFGWLYRRWHPVRLADPSCPFVLASGDRFREVAAVDPVVEHGFWWEFHARAVRAGCSEVEVPIHHRTRAGGGSRVYRPMTLVPLVARHLLAMWRLRRLPGALG